MTQLIHSGFEPICSTTVDISLSRLHRYQGKYHLLRCLPLLNLKKFTKKSLYECYVFTLTVTLLTQGAINWATHKTAILCSSSSSMPKN